ncbi:MAG: [Fe-Fe] hydrogenase large subunit C-terminal domain-containing protein [Bradymonadales bacterium]|jgi:iron only hydrogenase large subunit-like protein
MTEFLRLKKSNCKNCYKCIRNCPVKSIRFSGGQAMIIGNECILCGHCFVVCPQNAKEIASSLEAVKVLLQSGDKVIASLAPSFIANYNGAGIDVLRSALIKLGFADVEETAIGATIVKREYDRMLAEEKRDILISSCCHTVNLLIQKYFPNELQYLADIMSPMQAHCLDIKRRMPEAKTVFIGPCLAKKDEADHYESIVDAVLTFEELSEWLSAENITLDIKKDSTPESLARFFPTTGGILKTMDCDQPHISYLAIDGIENCIAALKDIQNGNIHHCFIEMSACAGSCIGGPVMEKNHRYPVRDFMQVSKYAGERDFNVSDLPVAKLKKFMLPIEKKLATPSESEIAIILKQMGKYTKADELNCGSCGYNSCREKAIAVHQGKAVVSMCMPFLTEKAESFSEMIINNSPNCIIVLNDAFEVQQINDAALEMMNIRSRADVLGEQVVRILDPKDFVTVFNTGVAVENKRCYLPEYKKYVYQTITYDKNYNILVCTLRDVTDEENERAKKESIRRQTIDITDKVVDKQLLVVQEIASLLGETAAETKIALTKLKESIQDE